MPPDRNASNLGIALSLAGLSVLNSSGQLLKWGGWGGLAVYAVIMAALAIGSLGNGWLQFLWRRERAVSALAMGLVLLFVIAFFGLYALAHSEGLGAGSDRDEALNIALDALQHGRFPYSLQTHFGNPITPMPGALLLAYPFFLMGNAAYQNLFWLVITAIACWKFFPTPKQALLFLCVMVFGNLSFAQDFVTGGDYSVNLLYVTLATALFYLRLSREADWSRLAWPAVFLGIALASRPIYVIVLPVLFAQGWRDAGFVKSLAACSAAFAITALLIAPFYLHDPAHFSPLHVTSFASRTFAHAAVILPGLALLIAALSFVLKLDRYAIFGLLAASLSVMFLPAIAANLGSPIGMVVLMLGYCYPMVAWAGIWLASRQAFQLGSVT
jgi:hypothetical protein